tara:strand:- start:2187 stop:3005 length:819 start_codon:yes stop_codon:yes gene_type:complete
MKSINIIRDYNRGDVLFVDPILRQLSAKYRANLTTKRSQLFAGSEPYTVNKFGPFDFEIDLNDTYESQPKQHILKSYIQKVQEVIDIELSIQKPCIQFTQEEQTLIQSLSKQPFIIINIDPSDYYRPPREVFGLDIPALAAHIETQYKIEVFEVGMFVDHGLKKITIANEREAMVMIQAAKLLIGLDSLCLHIAHALDTPAVGFFGSVNPEYRLFEPFNGRIIQQYCEQQHCYHDIKNPTEVPSCKLSLHPPKCAMTSNTEVLHAVEACLME